MAEKNKDLFLDMIENPYLTLEDLASVGHSAESSRFLDKGVYENSQRVRNKFTDSDGNFKQDEFDRWYAMASNAYNILTDKDSNLSIMNVTAYDLSDITVSPEKRTLNTKPIISFSPNPERLSTSIYQINKTSDRERTLSELALAEKVLLNPVEAAKDPSKARWGDSPNDSWWSSLTDTLVLAQWDEDGEHIDPVTGRKVKHAAGDLKLNDNGTYYYEALDGRDIYGRQVLNKLNTITTDGSFWNQYDFFDSDDIREKSFAGSVMKNLALVGSMFIPYVGWGIAGASIATQTIGLAGTLGKMLTGSDSPTFSAWEGFAKSWNRQGAKSEYAQQNMLCWENFIDLIGDTTAQLREQRAIFKFAPAILGKGKYGIGSEHFGMNGTALKNKITKDLADETVGKIDFRTILRNSMKPGSTPINYRDALKGADSIISQIADDAVKKYFKDYNEIGEKIARAYMVGITVGDTYGEAKEAGATDAEATLLTLGYAAAENKLLNSELGQWIFPELKGESATMKMVARKATEPLRKYGGEGIDSTLRSSGIKAERAALIKKHLGELSDDVREASKNLSKLDKIAQNKWMKKIFNMGRDIYDNEYSVLKKTAGSLAVGALAEGTEEVSEELLKDFSTSCFNVVKALQGNNDVRMLGYLGTWDWNEALKRYGMSFAGGVIGGGINGAATDYKQFKDIHNMKSEEAIQQLVWMDRNGEMDKFWDVVNNTTLGNKDLSTRKNEDGSYKIGTPDDNLDLEVKRALRLQVDFIHNILTAEGASLDDEGLINQVMKANPRLKDFDVLGNFRANALATSVTAGRFLKEYNRLTAAIVMESNHLNTLLKQSTDAEKDSDDVTKAVNESKSYLKTLQQAKADLLAGERTREFYRDALFETTYGLSESFIAPTEVQFMEQQTGKKYALISEPEKEALRDKYAEWSKTERSEQIHLLAEMFHNVAGVTSEALQNQMDTFEKLKLGQLQKLKEINDFSSNKLKTILEILSLDDIQALEEYGADVFSVVLDFLANLHNDKGYQLTTPLGYRIPEGSTNAVVTNYDISSVVNDLATLNGAYILAIQDIKDDNSLTPMEKRSKIIESFNNIVVKELTDIADDIIASGYIHPEVKRNLVPTLNKLSGYTIGLSDTDNITIIKKAPDGSIITDNSQEFSEEDKMNLMEGSNELYDRVLALNELSYTPIQESLRNFAIGLGTDKNVLDIIQNAVEYESKEDNSVDNILLDENTLKQYDEAEKILKLYRSAIVAARVDNADFGNVYGYNKVLNSLALEGDPQLAEIDKETADLAILDVNLALNRLDVIKQINALNAGNKLNMQNKTAINKNIIMFNKTRRLITSLLDDKDEDAKKVLAKWKGLDELKAEVLSLSLLSSISEEDPKELDFNKRKLSLNSDEKFQLEIETHKLDDAIYSFFEKNADKLSGTEEATQDLADFISASKLNFYSKNEELLTVTSNDVNDGSYLWLLAAKAALKHSDAYKVYKDVIEDTIAPIPTQEIGVFAALAAIYNGNVFSAFGKAARAHINRDWRGKTLEERNAVINSSKLYTIDPNTKLKLPLLPVEEADLNGINYSDLLPSYDNILFIEGIPGSGKSTGVFETIAKVLNKLNPEIAPNVKFLNKPIYVAHSNTENAEGLRDNLKLEGTTQVFGKTELLSKMSADYTNNEDPDSGEYTYEKDVDVIINDLGELHSTWKINKLNKDDIPSLIFIDEWSRYTLPEVDLVNRFALHYGILIIAAGDMDQLSPSATVYEQNATSNTQTPILTAAISRNMTPFIPKLGVSMRTGNGLKTKNLLDMQAYQRSAFTGKLLLKYAEVGGKLYGDKVHKLHSYKVTAQDVAALKVDIDKMVADLKKKEDGTYEKIGYIYSDTNSELYKLLTSDAYKDKIDPKNEAAAQGLEARYYIIENDVNKKLELKEEYFRSLYTGISRASQASIVLTKGDGVCGILLTNPPTPDTSLIPDSFTSEGIARFAGQRKEVLNRMYPEEYSGLLSSISARTPIRTTAVSVQTGTGSTLSQAQANALAATSNLNSLNNNLGPSNNQGGTPPPAPTPTPPSPNPPAPTSGTNPAPTNNNPNPPQAPTPEPEEVESEFSVGETLGNGENFIKIMDVKKVGDSYQYTISDGVETRENVTEQELKEQGYSFAPFSIDEEAEPVPKPTQSEPEPEPEPPTASFLVEDRFILEDGKTYTITVARQSDDRFVYLLMGPGRRKVIRTEESLEKLKNEGKYISKDDILCPEGSFKLEELAVASQGQGALETIIEEDAAATTVEPLEIRIAGKDIHYTVFGHTWNTNYTGVKFDDDGKPILPQEGEPGTKRIDQANGLVKLNGDIFDNKETILKTLGRLKKSIEFDSNEQIEKVLKLEIPALQDLTIQLNWAFISKSKVHKKGDGGRFYYDPSMKLENMTDEEHAEIPIKTLSLLVSDEAGNCVLELPVMTLGSPFTALHKLGELNKENPVYKKFKESLDNKKPAYQILEDVMKEISKNASIKNDLGGILPGYLKLYNMCKLWCFSSDGIKIIRKVNGEDFNLAKHAKNTGSHYVKYRTTELTLLEGLVAEDGTKKSKFDYSGQWFELPDVVSRKDVNYSNLMLATNDWYDDSTKIAPSGHTFVLRSDSDEFLSDAAMLNRYIALLKDPTLTKIVTLELVSAPEISVRDYLEERAKGENCHYGNTFSAYRILNLVRKLDKNLWESKLDENTRNAITPILDNLDAKAKELTKEEGESSAEFASRVYRELALLIDVKALSSALFEMTYGAMWKGGTNDPKYDVMDRIDALTSQINPETNKPYLTGILYRPVCIPDIEAVGGPVFRIQTKGADHDYYAPNGKPFRIYSKYDTPIFELDNLADYFSMWAGQVTSAAVKPKGNLPPNVYYFDTKGKHDWEYAIYASEGKTKAEAKLTPNELLKLDYAGLLGKLDIKADDIPESISDLLEFLQKIVELYTNTPGNIAVISPSEKGLTVLATNIKVDPTLPNLPEKFKNLSDMKQKSLVSKEDGTNEYILTLTDSEENPIELEARLLKDKGTIEVDIPEDTKPVIEAPKFTFSPEEIISKLETTIQATVDADSKEKYQKALDIISTEAAAGKTKAEIIEALLKGVSRILLMKLKRVLGDEFFNTEEEVVTLLQEDNTVDEVCAITISKKLL